MKIFGGVRWPAGDPFELAATIREALVSTRRELELRRFAELLVLSSTGATYDPIAVWTTVIGEIAAAERADKRNSMFDLAAHVDLMPCPIDPDHLYGIVYAEQDLFTANVLGSGEPYRYWDNTDRPDDVSESDWARRAAVWSACIGDARTTSRALSVRVDHNTAGAGWDLTRVDDRHMLLAAVTEARGRVIAAGVNIVMTPVELVGPFAPERTAQ